MTHDDERRYLEREHAGYLSERRGYGQRHDLDAILQAKAEREASEAEFDAAFKRARTAVERFFEYFKPDTDAKL